VGALAALRGRVVPVLEDLSEDWTVYPAAVDSLDPPAFVVGWADPWTVPATHGVETARLEIIAVVGRVEAEPGVATLELMVENALAALAVAGFRASTIPPGPFEIGGLAYLAARIVIAYPVVFTVPEVP